MAQTSIKISQITKDFNFKSKDVLDIFSTDLGIEKKSGATVDAGEFELFVGYADHRYICDEFTLVK